MSDPKAVVRTLIPLGEGGQAVPLAYGVQPVTASREDLVRISLVADVPNQAIFRCIKQIMQGQRELYGPKPRCKVATAPAHGFKQKSAQLRRQQHQLWFGKFAQILGRSNR